jgi:YfiR/HmsC-like
MSGRPNPESKRKRTRQRGACALLVLAAALFAIVADAPAQSHTEYQVKAAFLYNFARFVEWPAEAFATPDAPVQICVMGKNPFGSDLAQIVQGKSVSGHPVTVRSLRRSQEVRGCHIVFATLSTPARSKTAFIANAPRGILIVGEDPSVEGTMINFVLENDRVRFEVNNRAAAAAGLKISSKLLSLAIRITE